MIDKELQEKFEEYFLDEDGDLDIAKIEVLNSNILHGIVSEFNKLYNKKYLDEHFIEKCKREIIRKNIPLPKKIVSNSVITTTNLVLENLIELPKVSFRSDKNKLKVDGSCYYNSMNLFDLCCNDRGYVLTNKGDKKETSTNLYPFKHKSGILCYNENNKNCLVKIDDNIDVNCLDNNEVIGKDFLTIKEIFEFVISNMLLYDFSEDLLNTIVEFYVNTPPSAITYYSLIRQAKCDANKFIDSTTVLELNGYNPATYKYKIFRTKEQDYLLGKHLFQILRKNDTLTDVQKRDGNFKKLVNFTVKNEEYTFYYNEDIFNERGNSCFLLEYMYLRIIIMRLLFLLNVKKEETEVQQRRGSCSYRLESSSTDDGLKIIGYLKNYKIVTPYIKKENIDLRSKNEELKYYYQER